MRPALDDSRRERAAILGAIDAALTDPVRLIGILLQVRRVVPGHRARVAEELRVLRADWGPPIEAQIRFTGRRSAVLSFDGTERSFRAGGVNGVLERIGAFVLEEVAVPRLRPVAATITGLPDGPIRMTYTPARSGQFEYPDDPIVPEAEG